MLVCETGPHTELFGRAELPTDTSSLYVLVQPVEGQLGLGGNVDYGSVCRPSLCSCAIVTLV